MVAIFCACFAAEIAEAQFATIPESDRMLSTEEVKNFWIHQIRKALLGSRPLGLEPEKQKKWDALVAKRKGQIAAIKRGSYDNEARLAQLRHNAEAWKRLGNLEKSRGANQQMMELEVHLAQLEALEADKKKSEEEAKAAQASVEHMKRLESEIKALRAQIASSQH